MSRISNERSLLLYLRQEQPDEYLWTDLGPWLRRRIRQGEYVGNLGKIVEEAAIKGHIIAPVNVRVLQEPRPDLIHTTYMAYFNEAGKVQADEYHKNVWALHVAWCGVALAIGGFVIQIVQMFSSKA